MDLAEILTLVKAGYTKDEIAQLQAQAPAHTDTEPVQSTAGIPEQTAEPEPAPAQVVEPVAPAKPAPAPAPVPAVQPVQNPVQNQPTMADIMQSIAKLTSAVQANAIAQSVIPGGLTNPPSAEDMIAEIIRPTFKGKE